MSGGISDAVRLPNGKTTTRARARARGWIDADGNLTASAPQPSDQQRLRDKAERAAQWRRSQGLPPLDTGDTPEERAALTGKPAKKPKPLKPRNVSPDGEPITDEETLAEIAERTARIEFEKAAVAEEEKP